MYLEYPNDTSVYYFYNMNAYGNPTEEYIKRYPDDIFSESRTFDTYSNNKLILSVKEDLISQVSVVKKYKYKKNNDTLFTFVYEDDKLILEKKNYQDNEVTIEVSKSINDPMYYVDSLFHEKNKYKYVSYYADGKNITRVCNDEHGNEIEYISEIWDKTIVKHGRKSYTQTPEASDR